MEITLRRNVTRHDGSAPWTLRADLAERALSRAREFTWQASAELTEASFRRTLAR